MGRGGRKNKRKVLAIDYDRVVLIPKGVSRAKSDVEPILDFCEEDKDIFNPKPLEVPRFPVSDWRGRMGWMGGRSGGGTSHSQRAAADYARRYGRQEVPDISDIVDGEILEGDLSERTQIEKDIQAEGEAFDNLHGHEWPHKSSTLH